MDQATERRSAGARWGAAVLGVFGSLMMVPVAALFGIYLGYAPYRMECSVETLGSGCPEGELEMSAIIFVVIFLPLVLGSLLLAVKHRKDMSWPANWWPFILLCAVPLVIIVAMVFSAAANPNEYL